MINNQENHINQANQGSEQKAGFALLSRPTALRQIGEDLYAIGEELEPGTGGLKTIRSVYNIAIDAWSPEALVLEEIWRGIGK